ncbi:hypothetical protein HY968_04050 [Candidatus Kaiserbacteria bacterium]|nr:hypothetical protein [Candidatus Kaiserbacteria bacterium]
MLTDKDIDKLTEIFPTRPEVKMIVEKVFEEKFEEKIAPFQREALSALDKLATAVEKQNFGNAVRDTQFSRHDSWIHTIAKKTKVALKD